MSFSVDQFMQVKCKFTLTSETESTESIYTNNEHVRLCKSVQFDDNDGSILIVMVCSNETSNNHILAYYIERPHDQCPTSVPYSERQAEDKNTGSYDHSLAKDNKDSSLDSGLTFSGLTQLSNRHDRVSPSFNLTNISRRSRTKPKIIVKQIYYHNYNEDIVAICLSQTGSRLVLINASSTIYIIPIKNILLNIHAHQLRSSQSGSMYLYDASILNPCSQNVGWSLNEPVDIVCWETSEEEKSILVIASHNGKLTFISVDDKREICSTSVGEPIKRLEIIQEIGGRSLLITCTSFNQYRQLLEFDSQSERSNIDGHNNPDETRDQTGPLLIKLPKSKFSRLKTARKESPQSISSLQPRSVHHLWAAKPVPIRLHSSGDKFVQATANRVMQRVFTPTASHLGAQTNLAYSDARSRPLTLLGYQQTGLISLIDVLGTKSSSNQPTHLHKFPPNKSLTHSSKSQDDNGESRLVRFYSSKHYFNHQAGRPQIICKLDSLEPDELITTLILTDRFIAYTTDRDRCIIESRNCCKLRGSSVTSQSLRVDSLDPRIKEITFNHEEKIKLLIKSPTSNDQDGIIDSFLLVTTRSIYSIEARHNCRELFINLIDSHLAIKRTLFMSKAQIDEGKLSIHSVDNMATPNARNQQSFNLNLNYTSTLSYDNHRNAESNLLINNFLQHHEVYERICHDSNAFSLLFKIELYNLYETYADRLLQRGQLDLANRFFQMASFDHAKILGKYIRASKYREAIDYVKDVLNDENDFRKVMSESEKIEISKMAFECLLAKAVVERSKVSLFRKKLDRQVEVELLEYLRKVSSSPMVSPYKQPPDIVTNMFGTNNVYWRRVSPINLCEHYPQGQDAKLSAATIVPPGYEDEEETLTTNTGTNSSGLPISSKLTRAIRNNNQSRSECEKALIDFAKNFMPASMYEYTVDQLLDFNLIDMIDTIAQTDAQILLFLKMIIRDREEDRLVFRLCKLDSLTERLNQLGQGDLTRISIHDRQFLDFLTSARVNRALVKDVSLICDFYRYQHTLVQFRKYSFAALRQLETLKQLVGMSHSANCSTDSALSASDSSSMRGDSIMDDEANDGMLFNSRLRHRRDVHDEERYVFNEQQRQTAENIFIEFLVACLDESTDDSCRLWSNYINYYLKYIGSLDQLQADILRMIETNGDCRLAISLYKAIYRDETFMTKTMMNHNAGDKRSLSNHATKNGISNKTLPSAFYLRDNKTSKSSNETEENNPSLDNLFKNEFLMRLLERTLDLLTQSVDLDALSIATMC